VFEFVHGVAATSFSSVTPGLLQTFKNVVTELDAIKEIRKQNTIPHIGAGKRIQPKIVKVKSERCRC
jgi:hypothetical protein